MKFDIDFAVPFRHRVRFTNDMANREFDVLLDLLEPTSNTPAKTLVVVDSAVARASFHSDSAVAGWLQTIVNNLQSNAKICLLDCSSFNQQSNYEQNSDAADLPALVIEGGEVCKNDSQEVERVLALINHFDIDRRSYIIAIGGGAVLDAVGYAAAIAHRGVRLIRVPTTTLAQDDSGVGVKNAINYFNKKNWVGTFAVPWGVINDAKVLESLDDRDFRCGFSEAVKVSLLKSADDFDYLCQHAAAIGNRKMDVAFEAVKRSCVWHLKHITKGGDPFELLEARPLDFGHWSAHKMESLTDYRIRHGEAVGIGVALDTIYSSRVLGFSEEDTQRVLQCLSDLGMDLWDPVLDDVEPLLAGLEEFRQHLGGRLTLTLLKRIGQPVDVHEIDVDEMKLAVSGLKHWRAGIRTAS